MSLEARKELINSARPRYKVANYKEKHKILNEVIENTGYHKKYATALLNKKEKIEKTSLHQKRPKTRKYNEEIKRVFINIWKNANEICSKA